MDLGRDPGESQMQRCIIRLPTFIQYENSPEREIDGKQANDSYVGEQYLRA
jgi:hypothetical protein